MVAAIAGIASSASAQSVTTGAVQGRVLDKATKEPLAGVTVVATGASPEPQSTLTEEDGTYKITELLPGDYVVTFYVGDITISRSGIHVSANDVTPVFQNIGLTDQPGQIIEVESPPPQINPASTTKGSKYDRKHIERIPTAGRGFESTAGNQPGTHNDGVGLAVSGSTSLENRYLVDGIDITGLTYGTVGTPILSEFIEEVEVIAGGYNAEWGRAIGGIVNVITRSGSNTFRGSVFGTMSPGFLAKRGMSTPVNASSIDVESNRAYSADFGVELGGPIIKDRLFFYVGLAPQLARTDYTRITKRQTDCRQLLPSGELSGCDARIASQGGFADGSADVDPATGFYITDELDRETRTGTSAQYTALGKLNLAITPKNQAQLSMIAVPSHGESPGLYGLPSSGGRSSGLTTDAALRWTSKLNDDRTEVEAVIAWHRSTSNSGSIDPTLDNQPRQILRGGNLGTWSALGGESARTAAGCSDGGAGDPYSAITNCPMETVSYAIGGPGSINRDLEDRRMARLTATQRFRAAGTHELKAGLDFEADTKEAARLYSGGDEPQSWRLGFSKVLLEVVPHLFGEQLLRMGQGAVKKFLSEIERIRQQHVEQQARDGGQEIDRFTAQHYVRLHTMPLGQWMVLDFRLLERVWNQAPTRELVAEVRKAGPRLGEANRGVVDRVCEALGQANPEQPVAGQTNDRGLFEAVAQIVALRRATAPVAMDVLERFVMPVVHIGVPEAFPPLDDDDLAALRKGIELFALFVEIVPHKHPADEAGFLRAIPVADLASPYRDRTNLEISKGDWVIVNPRHLGKMLSDLDPKRLLERYDDFVKALAADTRAPRRRDDGRLLADAVVRAVADLRGAVATSLKEDCALVFRMLPPAG